MTEVKFIHPYEDDYHRARIETSSGIPIAEVSVTVDEEIYYNYMNALELYLKAKFAENMMVMIGIMLDCGCANSVERLTGEMCALSKEDKESIYESFAVRTMKKMFTESD